MLNSLDMRDGMQLLLSAVILFAAYCISLGMVARQTRNRGALPVAAAVLLCIFGCIGMMLFMIYQITGDSSVMLFMILLVFSLFGFGGELWFIMRHGKELNKGAFALLLTYVLAVLLVTLFLRQGGSDHRLQMHLFEGVGEALQKHSLQPVWHMFQNVALFMPIGCLFPVIHHSFGRFAHVLVNGLMLSVWIETMQMITASGICDINDILTNTLGTALGYGIFWVCRGRWK